MIRIFRQATHNNIGTISLILLFVTSTPSFGQWTTDGGFIEPNGNNNNNQRSVRIFTSLAGADRGFMVYSGNPGNVGTLSMELTDHSLLNNPYVELNGNARDLKFSINDISRIFVDQTNGFVGLGNEAPDTRLHISGNLRMEGSSPVLSINRQSGTTSAIAFTTSGTTNASLIVNQNGMGFKAGVVGPQISSNIMQIECPRRSGRAKNPEFK